MGNLIDKDAVLAEIDNLIDKDKYHDIYQIAFRDGNNSALYALKGRINTLEVNSIESTPEKELAETYLRIFDKKFSDKLPKLKGKHLADFKNFINTCEQMFSMKYFDIHSTQGVLFEKMALLWAVWGQEHLINETN